MNCAELFVRSLEAEGVEYVFGLPGEENLDLLEALRTSETIQFVLTRHEQAAGFMAATYGRLTGHPGVCLATLGPGATNLTTPAAYAQLGGMPLVMLTGQKPIKSSKQGRFQILDIVDVMQPLTHLATQVVSGEVVPALVREAFRVAREERPGAVLLELPEDPARDPCEGAPLAASYVRRPLAEASSIERAVEAISSASRPLLLVGAAANRNRVCRSLRAFVQRTGIPFVTTQLGKGVIDERDPTWLGTAALSGGDFVHRAIEVADLIVNVGHDVVEKPPFFMSPDGPRVIHLNVFSAQVDPVYFPQLEVVGDLADAVERIGAALEPARCAWDLTPFETVRAAVQESLAQGANDPRFPVLPQRLVADVRRAMPERGVITLDNGIYKLWFARNYLAYGPNTILLDNALATMGAGLPSAIAAKLLRPDQPVLAVCGDGGFLMNAQELETAVRLGIDLVVLVLRDDGFGMIEWKQADLDYPPFGLRFKNPDLVALANAYGATGHRLEAAADLVPLLERCQRAGGVQLIDVQVDYSENLQVLKRDLPQASRALTL